MSGMGPWLIILHLIKIKLTITAVILVVYKLDAWKMCPGAAVEYRQSRKRRTIEEEELLNLSGFQVEDVSGLEQHFQKTDMCICRMNENNLWNQGSFYHVLSS